MGFAVITPLSVGGIASLLPPSWLDTSFGFGIVYFALYFLMVGFVTLICFRIVQIFGLHQILIFSITALIVTRGKQLLTSTSEGSSIIEAGTLFVACLLVFCIAHVVQHIKRK